MSDSEDWLRDTLPPSATVLELRNANRPAILLADIDGDRVKELIVAYQYRGENFLLLFKKYYNQWYPIVEIKGKGYAITDLMVVPLTNRGVNTLVVGWQIGEMRSQLFLLQWYTHGFKNLLTDRVEYSKLYAEDIYGRYGKDGQYELAIWVHDIGEAFNINVYRYHNVKGLMKANDFYPSYFKRIATNYKQLLQTDNFPYYWYYLADAQLKAKEFDEALISIEKALTFSDPYPSKEKMMELKNEIISKQNNTQMGSS